MFVLYDSRARVRTGKRWARKYPETKSGVRAMWDLVIAIEVPDEREDYEYLADTPVSDAVEVFNAYWACYGWHLNTYDGSMEFPEDVNVISTGVR